MRLIDADQLRYEVELCRETTDDFQKLIDQQPTVEAVIGADVRERLEKLNQQEQNISAESPEYFRVKAVLAVQRMIFNDFLAMAENKEESK